MVEVKNSGRIYASLVISGTDLDPESLSASLRLRPHKAFRRGDIRSGTEKWRHGYWELSSDGNLSSSHPEAHIAWLVDQLAPVRETLRSLIKEQDLKARISCFWIPETTQAILSLPPALLQGLSELGVSVDFDIYSDS